MSRALGDGNHKFPKRLVEAEPDVCRIPLTPGKNYFLVLGSDGLFDVLSPGQVGRIVKQMLDASGRSDGGESFSISMAGFSWMILLFKAV